MEFKTPPNKWSDFTLQQKALWNAAYTIARYAHDGQVDKAGAPYIDHVRRVSAACETIDGQIVALLHDVLEDAASYEDMVRLFPEHIVEAVEALTKPDHWVAYPVYIAQVARNEIAIEVKLADLRDNMNLERIPNPSEEDEKRVERYKKGWNLLTALKQMRPALYIDEN